jgi:hypothetical protein
LIKHAKINFFFLLYDFRKNARNRKSECAYGKGLEVLFSEGFVLYFKTDCLSTHSVLMRSELSVLEYAQHKIFRELGLLIPWNEA